MPPTDSREREAFEAWLAPSWSRRTFTDDEGETLYCEDFVQGAWVRHCAALSAAPQSDGWRPIAEAPKGGTHILLTNGTDVSQGWWEHEEPYIRERRDMDGRYIDQDESDGFDGWLDCSGGMQPDPTYFMYLPTPPKMTQTEGDE